MERSYDVINDGRQWVVKPLINDKGEYKDFNTAKTKMEQLNNEEDELEELINKFPDAPISADGGVVLTPEQNMQHRSDKIREEVKEGIIDLLQRYRGSEQVCNKTKWSDDEVRYAYEQFDLFLNFFKSQDF